MAKAKKKSKKKVFILSGLGVLLVVVVLLVTLAGNKPDILSVEVEDVAKRSLTEKVTANGKIYPIEQVVLRPEVTGEIVELPVEEGDKVKKGDLLIKIKQDQYIARVNRARESLNSARSTLTIRNATFDQVKSEYDRVKGLAEKNLASDKELELAKSNYLQAKASVQSQKAIVAQADESYKDERANLDKTTILAPIDGTISQLNVELSERVLGSSFSQGTHLLTVADLAMIETRVDVDENDIVRVAVGDSANVTIDAYRDENFKGIVTHIGNSAKQTGLGTQDEVVNFEVKIKILDVEEGKLKPGMSCDTEIFTDTQKGVISVPIQSVTSRVPESDEKDNDKIGSDEEPVEVVFVLNEAGTKVKMVEVKTGISSDDYFQIKSGLTGGEKVISGPYRAIARQLEDGKMVSVKKKESEEKPE